MPDTYVFRPPRRAAFALHAGLIALLLALVGALFGQAARVELGVAFLAYLLAAAFLAIPLPFLAFRLYSLLQAHYTLERSGLRLRWGLRLEHVPMSEVRWVRRAEEVELPLPSPWLRWPGGGLGVFEVEGLGTVEFMASQVGDLVLIATPERVFAISPKDAAAFLRAYEAQTELGSLTSMRPYSAYPSFLLSEVWGSRLARLLLVSAAALSLALLVWVGLAAPTRQEVSLGFAPNGSPLDPVPSSQLFLLPVVNLFFFATDFLLALYFYRRSQGHPLSYLLWGGSAVTAALFLGAVYFIMGIG